MVTFVLCMYLPKQHDKFQTCIINGYMETVLWRMGKTPIWRSYGGHIGLFMKSKYQIVFPFIPIDCLTLKTYN